MKNGKNTMKNKQKYKDDILRVIREIQTELAGRFTVRRIGVFGSFTKGGEGTESDVDIIVELAKPTFDNYMDLKFRLEDVLKRPVDLAMADTVKPRIKPIIEQEVIYA